MHPESEVTLKWRGQTPGQALYDLAMCIDAAGHHGAALEYMKGSVRLQGPPEAGYHAGKALAKLADFVGAIEMFEYALSAGPEHGPTTFELAKCLMATNQLESASRQLRRVLEATPAHPGAQSLCFQALLQGGHFQQAWDWLDSHPAILESRANRVRCVALASVLGRPVDEFLLGPLTPAELKDAAETAHRYKEQGAF